jgi:Tfp pilus assembly protein PilX
MQNDREVVPLDESASSRSERRGVALITALFGIIVLGVMMSGMHFSSTQEYRGTRNALVEQRAFAVAEYGLNSETSNWDRSRNLLPNFPVGSIDSTKVYPASGDTAWVKVSRLTENTFWVVSDGYASMSWAARIGRSVWRRASSRSGRRTAKRRRATSGSRAITAGWRCAM